MQRGGQLVKEFSMTPWEIAENLRLFKQDYNTKSKIKKLFNILDINIYEKDEERNDVYIYKTLRYPPKSTPPSANQLEYI